MSESIRVRSVLGRFLEHSRIHLFEAGEQSHYLIGSADLMPRNLDHRIEIVAPVLDPKAQQELSAVFDILLADNASAWVLGEDGGWERLSPGKGNRARTAQTELMRRARARGRRRNGRRQR